MFADADLFGIVSHPGGHELHFVTRPDGTVYHLEIGYDAPERIEHGIEYESLERSLRITLRSGDAVDDGIQDRRHALPRAGGNLEDFFRAAAQQVGDLVYDDFRLGGIHVYLVQHGDDLEAMVDGQVQVGYGLRLDALGSVHHQQRSFAGSDGTGDLVGKVHVPGSVDEVEHIGLPSASILHLYGMALYRDAFLPLQVHVVKHLGLHVP